MEGRRAIERPNEEAASMVGSPRRDDSLSSITDIILPEEGVIIEIFELFGQEGSKMSGVGLENVLFG